MNSVWQIIKGHLENQRHRINDKIRNYPPLIPACDAQFNHLLEERNRIAQELDRMKESAEQSLTQNDAIKCIEDPLKRTMNSPVNMPFPEAVQGLLAGDFSRLAPLFDPAPDGSPCLIIKWYESGLFANEQKALNEAFTCACFLGRPEVVEYLLARGIDPSGGDNTGLNAFHWAANRGQLEVVEILIRHKAALESINMYGGTVLGCAVYSAINESRANHLKIMEALVQAGAEIDKAGFPTGNDKVDEVLRRYTR